LPGASCPPRFSNSTTSRTARSLAEERRRLSPVALAALATGLVVVVLVISRVVGGDGGGIKRKSLAKGLDGPVVVLDPDGARYTLPKGWTVDDVTKSGTQRYTAITGQRATVRIRAMRGREEKASDVARDAGGVACAPDKQQPVRFGGVEAVKCAILPVGRPTRAGEETTVYYANARSTSWVVRIEGIGTAPAAGADLDRFLASVRLT
jgi:hypothetical protein